MANDAECGEGGEIIPVNHDPFMLRLDESNYRIAIPFAGGVITGSKLFSRFSDLRFRQFTMTLMLLVAIGVLLA